MRVELLWFEDCPNHERAEEMLREVLAEAGVVAEVERVEVPDLETGERVRFPGSPTIRVDGVDVEPGWSDCEECTPRCRLYATSEGLRGLPERGWIVEAVAGSSTLLDASGSSTHFDASRPL
jgi:hypothetical protein